MKIHDREGVHRILDAGLVAQVAIVEDGNPVEDLPKRDPAGWRRAGAVRIQRLDEPDDHAIPVWAGVLPLTLQLKNRIL
jgi:hypothetical protein